ncbi:MAG: substrate-binding domain-containing protein [Coprococcus sp.]|nr:substrate-binding domain-containing protein [Coprococcus sp.]
MGIGAMAAIGERKLPVPERAAVVGYDDIDMARYLSIPLTTVNQKNTQSVWRAQSKSLQ